MKGLPSCLLALCACSGDDGGGGGISGTAHVETYELPAATAPSIDVLFVVDDTTAMASHQAPLAALPMQLDQLLSSDAVPANYHFGVVTSDDTTGALRQASAISGAFIIHDASFSGPANNYQGTLAAALASLFPNSATSTAANQPLQAARAALDNTAANAGFVRANAFLAVVTISASDDASTGAIGDYANMLKATKADPTTVIVSGVFEPASARLGAFHAQFPNRSYTQTIASTDYGGALEIFTQLYKTVLGYACSKEPADVDPQTPGPQYDCAFVSIENGVEKRLPQCGTSITQPCWEIVAAEPQICADTAAKAHLQTRGYTTSMSVFGDPFHPAIRGQCLVN